jgi:hypothetical protein
VFKNIEVLRDYRKLYLLFSSIKFEFSLNKRTDFDQQILKYFVIQIFAHKKAASLQFEINGQVFQAAA